jgi:hypothetical protein
MRNVCGTVATLLVWGLSSAAWARVVVAQATDVPPPGFSKTEIEIPMRDGVHLHTAVYVPTSPHAALPILFLRTPYGIVGAATALRSSLVELEADGYIFAFQDIRGRYKSEGQFVMMRPPRDRGDAHAVDESTDAYDTIDWLVKHVPGNNSRVGMYGVSYPGWLTVMAMLDPHPALKAVSPQASPADMYLGDDFHHNGAFRLSYGLEYATRMETNKEQASFAFDRYDTFQWYLRLGALSNVNARYLHGAIPTWNDFVAHPNYDQFWQRQAATPYMDRVTIPTLSVAGWWDQEDFYGPVTIYEALERHDTDHHNYLVVGPWNHGGWMAPEGQKLGAIDFGSPTSQYFRQHVLAPWFAFFLHDKGTLDEPEALTFEGGANTWRKWDSWPPKSRVTPRKLYVRAGHRLSFDPPSGAEGAGDSAFDAYVSDPAHPVPYRHRPIPPTYQPGGSGWPTWLVEDQRLADGRADVLSWETEPLTKDVVVAGGIAAHLVASTSGTDSDWIVKLIDVYPEQYDPDPTLGGYELMVANDVLRGRFREGYTEPRAAVPNHVDEYTVDLHTQDYRFKAGHRIMVQVQSTWFPIIDRNPQKFVSNIFEATDADFQSARQRVFRSPASASYVQLSVENDQ